MPSPKVIAESKVLCSVTLQELRRPDHRCNLGIIYHFHQKNDRIYGSACRIAEIMRPGIARYKCLCPRISASSLIPPGTHSNKAGGPKPLQLMRKWMFCLHPEGPAKANDLTVHLSGKVSQLQDTQEYAV